MPSKNDVIEIFQLDNPAYVSLKPEWLALVREYVETKLKIPSITYESFLNYLCSAVQGVFTNQLLNPSISQDAQKYKFMVGHINGKPEGFAIFYMLPDRCPHVATIEINHVYSRDPRLTYKFATEFARCKKLWAAKYVVFTSVNAQLSRVTRKLFRKPKEIGQLFEAEGIRDALIKFD